MVMAHQKPHRYPSSSKTGTNPVPESQHILIARMIGTAVDAIYASARFDA
jgi:hypothetical protein